MTSQQLHTQLKRKAALYAAHPHLVPQDGDTSSPGWAQIVGDALAQIARLEQEHGQRAWLAQIKPKWGSLRFYVGPLNASDFSVKLQAIRRAAEARSLTSCEECGAPGDLRRDGGFVFNGCEQHSRGCAVLPIQPGNS